MSKDPAVFDVIARRSLLVAILGVIVFVIPFFGFGFDIAKKLLLSVAVLVAFVSWLIARWLERSVDISRNYVFYALSMILVVALVSGLISPTPMISLFGLGFEHGTFLSLALYGLLTFLVAFYFRSKKTLVGLSLGIAILSVAVFVFQLIRVALPFLFSWTISFAETASNLVGKWNEFGIFLGFSIILSLVLLRVIKVRSASTRKILLAAIISGLIGLVVVNYWTVWLIVALFTLALVLYLSIFGDRVSRELSVGSEEGETKAAKKSMISITLVVLIVSLIFAVSGRPGGFVSNKINNLNARVGINVLEVRPSLQGTWQVASQSLKASPIFGAGPNRFSAEWIKYKPLEVNMTDFWGIDFQTGVGYWPTVATTLGGVGVVVILALLIIVFVQVIRAVLARRVSDPEAYALLFLAAVSTLYWWVFSVVYPVETVGLTMAFGSLGLLLAVLSVTGMDQSRKFELADNPKFKFAGEVAFFILLILGLAGIYVIGQKFYGVFTAQRAVYAFSVTGDLVKADRLITGAVGIDENDIFLRQYATIKMRVMDQIVTTQNEDQEAATAQFQNTYGQARQALILADQINPTNYQNKLLLGRLLEKLVSLKVEGAYKAAVTAYRESLTLNPTNPGIYLDLARLEITNNSLTSARDYITKALGQKPNYIAAISLLSQIEADQGNLPRAIEKAEQAVTLAPNDEGARFQLGFFLYQQGRYEQAVAALAEAVRLNPNFANAKYFLGLSYQETGEQDKALAIFEELARLNPENQELQDIINDLRSPASVKQNKKEE